MSTTTTTKITPEMRDSARRAQYWANVRKNAKSENERKHALMMETRADRSYRLDYQEANR